MRVLVIPDIHLKPWIFDRTEKILRDGKADRAVCLMDMPDDWNMEFQIERYKETFDRAIAFAEDYPDTLWCYGNHDVSYSWGRLETGYSPYAERTVMSKLVSYLYLILITMQRERSRKIMRILMMAGKKK